MRALVTRACVGSTRWEVRATHTRVFLFLSNVKKAVFAEKCKSRKLTVAELLWSGKRARISR